MRTRNANPLTGQSPGNGEEHPTGTTAGGIARSGRDGRCSVRSRRERTGGRRDAVGSRMPFSASQFASAGVCRCVVIATSAGQNHKNSSSFEVRLPQNRCGSAGSGGGKGECRTVGVSKPMLVTVQPKCSRAASRSARVSQLRKGRCRRRTRCGAGLLRSRNARRGRGVPGFRRAGFGRRSGGNDPGRCRRFSRTGCRACGLTRGTRVTHGTWRDGCEIRIRA